MISVGVITQALENIAYLRAQNGGSASRLAFNAESLVPAKDQYACGSWSDGGCGFCRGDNQCGEVLCAIPGLRIHPRTGKCQHGYRSDASSIRQKL